ncbi:MAG: segregation/condensation protein A [Gammaproteobacteria bacterium]|nr:segregation/condensation protein A [Gammaproteobacteria bacterium]
MNQEQLIEPVQEELPLAVINGEKLIKLPDDLYIPPEALEVFLETFEGPLDLLLYLIKKQNIDIVDIPIAKISHQYVQYIEAMHQMKFELAAEYLVMAAMLAEIKSRMLLPKVQIAEEEVEDPRAELIRRLQEYEQIKQGAEELDKLPRMERDIFQVEPEICPITQIHYPDVQLSELVQALQGLIKRADNFTRHEVKKETLSIREKMSNILEHLKNNDATQYTEFTSLFNLEEGRRGIVITFMAILELSKQFLIEISQNQSFSSIYLKAL